MAPAAIAPRMLFAMILSGLMFATLSGTLSTTLSAQVSFERLRDASDEPENWLTYLGDYFSQRYSELDQVRLSFLAPAVPSTTGRIRRGMGPSWHWMRSPVSRSGSSR